MRPKSLYSAQHRTNTKKHLLALQARHGAADMEPSNEMLVDPEDFVTEQPEAEKDEVAIITPEALENDVDMPDRIRADDCE